MQHLFRCFLSSPVLETNLRKPSKTKRNGTIYKGIVKTSTRVQSFFAGLRNSGQQNHKFDKLVCVDASSSKNIQKPVVFVNYHFLWSTHKSGQQPQQATIVYGRLKIQTTTVLHRYFESRQWREGEREREIKEERKKETYRDILNDIVVCGAFFSAKMLKSSWFYAVFARSFSIPLRLKKWFSIDFGETNSLVIEYFFVRHFPPKIEMIDGSYKCHIKCFRIG